MDGFVKGALVSTKKLLSLIARGPNIYYLGNNPPKQ